MPRAAQPLTEAQQANWPAICAWRDTSLEGSRLAWVKEVYKIVVRETTVPKEWGLRAGYTSSFQPSPPPPAENSISELEWLGPRSAAPLEASKEPKSLIRSALRIPC